MIEITDPMRGWLATALADGTPCLLGTVGREGWPQVSPKGSMAVYDGKTLSFWERSHRTAERNITANPRVVVYYRNAARAQEIPYRGAAIRFHGAARIVADGPERERAWDLAGEVERSRDPEKKGAAVLIRIDRIEELSGATIMED